MTHEQWAMLVLAGLWAFASCRALRYRKLWKQATAPEWYTCVFCGKSRMAEKMYQCWHCRSSQSRAQIELDDWLFDSVGSFRSTTSS